MTDCLHARTAAAPPAPPEAWLRALPEGPRAFWSHGQRWAVFGGAAATLTFPAGPDRFVRAREAVDALLARVPAEARAAVRLVGGFAFGNGDVTDPAWDGFPAGRLILPALTICGGPDGAVLTACDRDPDAAGARSGLTVEDRTTSRNGFRPARRLPARVDGFAAWAEGVRDVLAAVARGDVQKVVLARTLDVRFPEAPDPVALLARVRADNPHSTVYFVEPRPGTVLLGAAPEVLVTLHEGRFLTTAVAGSTARGASAAEDARLARRLMDSPKERSEHGFGVDDIVSRLSPFTERVEIEAQPRVLRLQRIQHLETDVAADVAPEVQALDLVGALHPTAAVSGAPREPATALLTRVEALDRGWYAGPVGWCDGAGNGEFAPALRCAVGQGRDWRLFAGAGIVAGSDPDREWSETAMKFEPMLHALGAAGA